MDIRNWMKKGVSASASASSRSTTSTDGDTPPSVAGPSQLPASSLTSGIPAKVRTVNLTVVLMRDFNLATLAI